MGKLKDFIWSCKDDFRKHPVKFLIVLIVLFVLLSTIGKNDVDQPSERLRNTYETPRKQRVHPDTVMRQQKASLRKIFGNIVRSKGHKCDSCSTVKSIPGTECFSVSCDGHRYVYKVCEDISGEWKVSSGS